MYRLITVRAELFRSGMRAATMFGVASRIRGCSSSAMRRQALILPTSPSVYRVTKCGNVTLLLVSWRAMMWGECLIKRLLFAPRSNFCHELTFQLKALIFMFGALGARSALSLCIKEALFGSPRHDIGTIIIGLNVIVIFLFSLPKGKVFFAGVFDLSIPIE